MAAPQPDNMAKEKEQWWSDNHSEDKLSDAFEEAASEKLERESELEQAKHALELAKIEAEKARIEGTSQSPTQIPTTGASQAAPSSNDEGGKKLGIRDMGFWWLSSGETIAVIIATTFVLGATLLIGISAMGEKEWPTTIGTVLELLILIG